ncbi:MAG: response regulator [Thermodesulfovibrionales bacterium]|nr:response regulator [Thermodesulfovibrionales bacterium]
MPVSVLIVEDEIIVAMDLRLSVEDMGYDVSAIAFSGHDAILQAASLRPDVILMDIKLKGEMDGISAVEHIRKEMDVPVIYITGNSDDSTMERAMQSGPAAYISKPVIDELLRNTIEKVVGAV